MLIHIEVIQYIYIRAALGYSSIAYIKGENSISLEDSTSSPQNGFQFYFFIFFWRGGELVMHLITVNKKFLKVFTSAHNLSVLLPTQKVEES